MSPELGERVDAESIVVHVGYHKTGSSWLQRSLFPATPGVDMIADSWSVVRELVAADPFRFDPDRARAALLRLRSRTDAVTVISAERLSGHPDSGGFDAKTIADRVAATFPEARVLIVIRRQDEMLAAMHGEYVRTGGSESLRRYASPLKGGHRSPRFDMRHLEYDRLVSYYQDLFGTERVAVLPFEYLQRDSDEFTQRVTSFCSVEPPPRVDQAPAHPSLSPVMIGFKRRLNLVVGRDAVNPVGLIAHDGLSNRVANILNRADRHLPRGVRALGRSRRDELAESLCRDRFGPSNRRTEDLTGLDLGSLGYPS